MSAFLLGSVFRGLSRAGWLGAKTLTFGQETGAAPDEVACLTSMHDSISREVIRDAHLQAVGPGEQGAFGHPDRGPLPDERGPHARPEEGRDLVQSALLVCRSNHKVRFDARSRNLSPKFLLPLFQVVHGLRDERGRRPPRSTGCASRGEQKLGLQQGKSKLISLL